MGQTKILEKFRSNYIYQVGFIAILFVSGTWIVSEKVRVEPQIESIKKDEKAIIEKDQKINKLEKEYELLINKNILLQDINKNLAEELESLKFKKEIAANKDSKLRFYRKKIDFDTAIRKGEILLKRASGEIPNSIVTKSELDNWITECLSLLGQLSDGLSTKFKKRTYNKASDLEKDPFILEGLTILRSINQLNPKL